MKRENGMPQLLNHIYATSAGYLFDSLGITILRSCWSQGQEGVESGLTALLFSVDPYNMKPGTFMIGQIMSGQKYM